MRRLTKIAAAATAALLAVGLTACTSDSGAEKMRDTQREQFDRLAESQPASSLTYSPVRDTMNFWVETWDEPGKLSYVYLQSASGGMLGYYVLEGLPVSYCAKLTPSYDFTMKSGSTWQVDAPGMDGAYYTGSGSCDTYYGKDATTGAYIEYTAGMGINVLLFDEPMPRQVDVQPLGATSIEDVQ